MSAKKMIPVDNPEELRARFWRLDYKPDGSAVVRPVTDVTAYEAGSLDFGFPVLVTDLYIEV